MNFYHIGAIAVVTVLAVATAAPVDDVTTTPKPVVAILNKKSVVNDDGSYTYGYEGADGSFKVETRDAKGFIKGRYGYIDADGNARVLEYQAGTGTGFSPVADHIPLPDVPVQVPKSEFTPEAAAAQRLLDAEYNSVDADEDGIPDAPGTRVVVAAAPVAKAAARPVHAPVTVVKAAPAAPVPAETVVKAAPAPVQVQPAPVPVVRAVPAPVRIQPAPLPVVAAVPQVIRQQAVSHFDQFFQDQQFNSVDLNEDGIPDSQQHVVLAAPQPIVPVAAPQVVPQEAGRLFTLTQDGQFVAVQNGAFQVQDGQVVNLAKFNGARLVQQPQLIRLQ